MKKHIQYAFIALAGGTIFLSACDNAAKKTNDHQHEHGHDHAHMDSGNTDRNTYIMKLTAGSEFVEAGKPVMFRLLPQIKGKEDMAVPLDMVHDKKIHLIVVSEDLAWFEHIHPEYNADGSYHLTTQFPSGGNYLLFADYQPSGAASQLEKN